MSQVHGLVSIIVVNWNGKGVIGECLESLIAQSYQPLEMIVIDNGSTDGSLEILKGKYLSSILLIKNEKNLGFAEGVNQGIRASRGEFIGLLNSDAYAQKDWIEVLVKGIQGSESISMCASKIYRVGEEGLLDNVGEVITRDGLGRGKGRLEKDHGQYDSEGDVLCPSGCAAFYRKKMLEEIGFFDSRFFAYAEDIDVGLRGRLLGYGCLYLPSAVVYHRFSSSSDPISSTKAFYVERNRLWVLFKCFPLRHLLLAPFHSLLRYSYHCYGLFRHHGPAARFIEKKSFLKLVFILLNAYLSTLWFLPYLLKQRWQLMRKKKVPTRQFEAWMKLYGMSARDAALNEL